MRKSKEAIQDWITQPNSSYFSFRNELNRFCSAPAEENPYPISAPTAQNSIAVVVTYLPDNSILENLRLLSEEFSGVVVVENSPVNQCDVILNHCRELNPDWVISNTNKNGLAGALNLGIRKALALRSEGWLFFFDQDTTLKPNFLKTVRDELSTSTSSELWNSIYGSRWDDRETEDHESAKPEETRLIRVPTLITSGSFLRIEGIYRIGLFIDELFIDSLDHEFCMRAKRFGFETRLIQKKTIFHALGDLHVRKVAWRKRLILTHNHPPFRWYFFTRNFIFSIAENFPSSSKWFLNYSETILKTYLKVLLYEDHKVRKTKAALLGFIDGIRMVFGKNKKRDLSRF